MPHIDASLMAVALFQMVLLYDYSGRGGDWMLGYDAAQHALHLHERGYSAGNAPICRDVYELGEFLGVTRRA